MSFVAWTFLLGAVAVAGPVFAHFLAKPRYKRVPFTMLQFLKTSQIESHSRRHLRDLLILLLRCAIIILIAFLFAQPILFIKPKPRQLQNVYYLGLDDSASMAYIDGDTYFEKMKDAAIDYIVSAEQDGVFNLCSLVSGNWSYGLSKQQALAEVHSLRIKPKKADLAAFLSGLNNSSRNIKKDDTVSVYLISDFTNNILQQFLNIQEPSIVDNIEYKVIASLKPIHNMSITHAQAEAPASEMLSINVTVTNNGLTQQNRRLYALIDKEKITSIDIALSPGQSKVCPLLINLDSVKVSHACIPLELTLTPYDNLKEDDKYFISVQLPRQNEQNILLVETKKDEMFLLKTAIKTISGKNTADILKERTIPINSLDTSSMYWADILFCPKIPEVLGNLDTALQNFIETGGRAVFFLSDEPMSETAQKLWKRGVLPALPSQCIKEQAYLQTNPDHEKFAGIDNDALKALSNYRIDRIPLNGYWQCQQLPESTCLWRYQNETGFIYCKKQDNGMSILINTSIDDSLGSLFKSSASVAFCQCLLGPKSQVSNYSFNCDERIALSVDDMRIDMSKQKQIWIQDCNGQKQHTNITGSFVTISDSGGTGWVQTTTKPIFYAGVNLPAGETNMSRPAEAEVDNAISRVFPASNRDELVTADSLNMREKVPLWKYLVWILIILLLLETTVANRLKR